MQILRSVPETLRGDFHNIDSVALRCHTCGVAFLWRKKKGDTARCPECKTTETIPGLTTMHAGSDDLRGRAV